MLKEEGVAVGLIVDPRFVILWNVALRQIDKL